MSVFCCHPPGRNGGRPFLRPGGGPVAKASVRKVRMSFRTRAAKDAVLTSLPSGTPGTAA